MKIEIIAIGDELTSGRITNTTSSFAARKLFEAGFDIDAIHTIGDTPQIIGEALRLALSHADAVIVTGGLGPTDDDLTTEAVSRALGRPAMVNQEILAAIRHHLQKLGEYGMAVEHLEKLAWLPSGAEALDPWGKMAGYLLVHDGKPIYFLPGVPGQMRRLLLDHVLPGLTAWGHGQPPAIHQRLFRIFGLQETEVNRRIAALALPAGIKVGYYPTVADVQLNLVVRSLPGMDGGAVFAAVTAQIEEALGDAVYGHDQESMAAIVGHLLLEQKRTLATAESCTGGMIGQWLTAIPGSSAWYLGGVISYANSVKEETLGVPAAILAAHGAVSAKVAKKMAEGTRRLCRADLAVAVTGIAGPDGGSAEKPVGTVYIGLADAEDAKAERFLFHGNRQHIRETSAQTALNMVRKCLLAR